MQHNLTNYLQKLKESTFQTSYTTGESFLHLPFDTTVLKTTKDAILSAKIDVNEIKHIVVIGIGGSCWGAKAVYDALKNVKPLPEMHFLDQIEPDIIEQLSLKLRECPEEQAIIVNISKSGTTTEVATNYDLLKGSLSNKNFPEFFIRGKSATNKEKENILTLPDNVGGRFSVFSAVGLLPLELARVETTSLLEGAKTATKEFYANPTELTQQITSIEEAYKKGNLVYNMFVFTKELLSLAEWQKQLLGESLGKDKKGILPMISEGSRDLHSLQQYFVGGKKIVQHEIISVTGKNSYQDQIKNAVLEIYKEENIVARETTLEELSEFTLGKFMQNKFFETLLLAHLMEVNPFGQPDVEGYKRKLKKL
ncbi:hypothetical protein KBG31_02065 [Patescibacteria group bacterium]|nr:hypothetical protein [Patescibacteria group bacterium]